MNHTTLCVRLFAGMLFALFASCTKESASEITKLDELQTARFAVVTGTIADKLILNGLTRSIHEEIVDGKVVLTFVLKTDKLE